MPPRARITRQGLIEAGVALVRRQGMEALNARALAAQLGCSTQPIFSHFATIQQLKEEIIHAVYAYYQRCTAEAMAEGNEPPYKASGIAYIQFAQQEKELFRLLFMRDRSQETQQPEDQQTREILALVQRNTGLSEAQAKLFHLEMWVFVHGIASMCATSYLDLDQVLISRMLTDVYRSLQTVYQSKGEDER